MVHRGSCLVVLPEKEVIPMRRLGEMDEVVQAMLWACCDDNSFLNGAVIPIDGGLSAT